MSKRVESLQIDVDEIVRLRRERDEAVALLGRLLPTSQRLFKLIDWADGENPHRDEADNEIFDVENYLAKREEG